MTFIEPRFLLKYLNCNTHTDNYNNNTFISLFDKVAEQDGSFTLAEKLVQILWNEQNLLTEKLTDDKGRPVTVLQSGTWNTEPGPDFKDAVITINNQLFSGDIEVHLRPEMWNQHGHQFDPAYKKTILHVVWENPSGNRIPPHIPHLEIKPQLKVAPERIADLIDINNYPMTSIHPQAHCSEQISSIPDNRLSQAFRAAGMARLQSKVCRFRIDVLKYGLEQAFFLALADAHGYKNNREAFRQLAKNISLDSLQALATDKARAAFIWGKSGLLPDPTQKTVTPELQEVTSTLWQNWWQLRSEVEKPLPWKSSSQRPMNTPERRLAALICLLEKAQYRLRDLLEEALQELESPKTLNKWFNELFSFTSTWENFCNFKTKLKKSARLIGQSRQLDIIVNVFIPAMAYILTLENRDTENLHHFYCALPRSQDNHVLDIARHKFFIPPVRMKSIIKKAIEQQGLIQLMQDYKLVHPSKETVGFWEKIGISIR